MHALIASCKNMPLFALIAICLMRPSVSHAGNCSSTSGCDPVVDACCDSNCEIILDRRVCDVCAQKRCDGLSADCPARTADDVDRCGHGTTVTDGPYIGLIVLQAIWLFILFSPLLFIVCALCTSGIEWDRNKKLEQLEMDMDNV